MSVLKGLISVKTEGKQHQKSQAFYWTLGQEAKTSWVSYLSPASKPVEVLRFSLTWNQRLSLVSLSICHVHHVLSHFWKFQSFNWFFLAFQWLCSVIQWMPTKMLGCYLQLISLRNPSPEMHELLGNGEERRRLFPTFHLQQARRSR